MSSAVTTTPNRHFGSPNRALFPLCGSVFMSGQYVLNETTSDVDIWLAGLVWPYIESRLKVKVIDQSSRSQYETGSTAVGIAQSEWSTSALLAASGEWD